MLQSTIAQIRPLDRLHFATAQTHLDSQTKPKGSLGVLERVACRLVAMHGGGAPGVDPARIYTCAGDHGVDLGEGGLCMEASSPLKTGTLIYVQLLNVNPEVSGLAAHRSSHGRVRWTRDLGYTEQTRFGIGVQYTHPICH